MEDTAVGGAVANVEMVSKKAMGGCCSRAEQPGAGGEGMVYTSGGASQPRRQMGQRVAGKKERAVVKQLNTW
jgi:hypothetical protein